MLHLGLHLTPMSDAPSKAPFRVHLRLHHWRELYRWFRFRPHLTSISGSIFEKIFWMELESNLLNWDSCKLLQIQAFRAKHGTCHSWVWRWVVWWVSAGWWVVRTGHLCGTWSRANMDTWVWVMGIEYLRLANRDGDTGTGTSGEALRTWMEQNGYKRLELTRHSDGCLRWSQRWSLHGP